MLALLILFGILRVLLIKYPTGVLDILTHLQTQYFEPMVSKVKASLLTSSVGFSNVLVNSSSKIWIIFHNSAMIDIISDVSQYLSCRV